MNLTEMFSKNIGTILDGNCKQKKYFEKETKIEHKKLTNENSH